MLTRKKQILGIYLFLTAITITAFWQLNRCDFINLDDPLYVTENVHIQGGITLNAIRWAFTTLHPYWHPLTWMAHMLDFQLFGLNARWYHLTNLLFHIANTLLLFFILNKMTKAPWKSAFVAALFAIHPLHVQSVAWVAERKDVLSTFFLMLTICAYVRYVEHQRFGSYLGILVFFALGLMSKPMFVTLPFALLLLDYWPLQRVKADFPIKHQWNAIRPLLAEKVPLFALAALSSVVTLFALASTGSVASFEVVSPGDRVANALVSYMLYIGKTIWPTNLAVFYPYRFSLPFWQIPGAALLLGVVTLTVILAAKRSPYLVVGWVWFVGTLIPVIGIVQANSMAMADHFTYVPLIGLFIMAAWGIPELVKRWRYHKAALCASSAFVLIYLLIVTWTQVGYWKNSVSLYDHALKAASPSDAIYCNRGAAYDNLGNYEQAIADFDRAIQINPKRVEAYNGRALVYQKLGNHSQAILDETRAIEINFEFADAYGNRGTSYYKIGDYRQAISDFGKATEINPGLSWAYSGRAKAYGALGNYREAISDFDRAIEINPKYADAYNDRGVAYGMLGNNRQAISDYARAIEIDPDYAAAYQNRGVAYAGLGNYGQAISDFDRAIEINPEYADAYNNRGAIYGRLGKQRQAIEDLQKAARLDNKDAKSSLRSIGMGW